MLLNRSNNPKSTPSRGASLRMGDLDSILYIVHSVHPSKSRRASWSVQPLMQGSLSWPTNRPTDHATLSVAIGRISLVLQCGLKWRIRCRPTCVNTCHHFAALLRRRPLGQHGVHGRICHTLSTKIPTFVGVRQQLLGAENNSRTIAVVWNSLPDGARCPQPSKHAALDLWHRGVAGWQGQSRVSLYQYHITYVWSSTFLAVSKHCLVLISFVTNVT